MSETIVARVLVVDPRRPFCEVIHIWLDQGGHVMLGQARNLEETMLQVDALHPNLVIVGSHLAENGLVVCREIVSNFPMLKTILFTARADSHFFQADAAYARVAACLPPETTGKECLQIVARVMAGERLFPHEILSLAFQAIDLTARELEVLNLMAEEKTDREIANTLGVRFFTIRNHTQRILGKFGVHSRQEAVWRARHRGLVRDGTTVLVQ